VLAAAQERPELQRVTTTFTPGVEQFTIWVDRDQVKSFDVNINDVFGTLQAYMGGTYVNDFLFDKKQFRVYVQADGPFRTRPEDISSFFVRSRNGSLVNLQQLVDIETFFEPPTITNFNVYEAIKIQGGPAPGYSSGQASLAMEEIAPQVLDQRHLCPGGLADADRHGNQECDPVRGAGQ